MNGLREALLGIVMTLVLSISIPAGYNPVGISAGPGLSIPIPLYGNPKVDGIVSGGEYPVEQLALQWVKLYAVHNASHVHFAMVLQNACKGVELLFNTGLLNSTVLSVSTVRYAVERSGELRYYYGRGNEWLEESVDNVPIKVVNGTALWTVELSIPLSRLDVSPNRPRELGFALMASGTGFNCSWPSGALPLNPSTWGSIYSPDNWATRVDIAVEGVFLDKKSLIAGSNLTLTAVFRNKGDAAIPDYVITITLDDDVTLMNATASQLGLKIPMGEAEWICYNTSITKVANGSHVIKVSVKALGVFYDADPNNDFIEVGFSARYARVNVFGTPGISVKLDGEVKVIGDESGTVFFVPAGTRSIMVNGTYSPVEGIRYVFAGWNYGGSIIPSTELRFNVTGDLELTAEYRKEYLVNLKFVDKDDAVLIPSSYSCKLGNGTVYNGTSRSLWVAEGEFELTMVKYAGLDVLGEAKVDYIAEPKEITVRCNVASGSIKIIDPFSMPIQGVELTVIFPNNTRAKYVTGPDGVVGISKVAGGELTLTIANLGYSTTSKVSFLIEREVTIRIPISLNVILMILGALSVVVVIIAFKIIRKGEKPAKTGEYVFEEL